MASSNTSSVSPAGSILFAVIIGVALNLLPLVFGPRVEVSPMVLFGIATCATVCNHLVLPVRGDGGDVLFSRTFFLRLAASLACAALILGIYRIALAIG